MHSKILKSAVSRERFLKAASGMAMSFLENHREYLLRRSKKFAKKLKIEDESIKRFIAYFNLHRTDGLKLFLKKCRGSRRRNY